MQPYLGAPRTHPHQIGTVDVFYHAPPIHGIKNAEMQNVIASVLYRVGPPLSIDTKKKKNDENRSTYDVTMA